MIQEHDEPVLKHLQDVNVKWTELEKPWSSILEFKFEPNEDFTNEVVTKVYQLDSWPLESLFEEPGIMGWIGFPPEIPQYGMLSQSLAAKLKTDFELGGLLREHIMLYFTGESDDAESEYMFEDFKEDTESNGVEGETDEDQYELLIIEDTEDEWGDIDDADNDSNSDVAEFDDSKTETVEILEDTEDEREYIDDEYNDSNLELN
ncbi:nucleosome assembly protein 1-like 1 [Scyliorhinus canicula]|uniref:nucleosome assembly protein 1-like 1 n=1 Tax=Scyliorhinus canicula TaxID=7830 RepID=UPI0018F44BCB|nr:nucleosome assembly protein 1-like 1 [Scyliorhinus canicula]